jgi:NitT/TauT family transport system permease protein
VKARLVGVGVLLLAVVVWQLVLGTVAPRHPVVPTPIAIAAVLQTKSTALLHALGATAQEAVLGFLAGSFVAFALGVVSLASRPVENNVYRLALTLHAIPLIVIAPLLVIWLGGGLTSRVIIAAMTCFFGVLVSSVKGFKSVQRTSIELLRVLAANPWQTFWFLRLPSAVPFLFAALRIAAVASVLGAVVGEWIGADQGLGVVMLFALFEFQTAYLWAAMLVCTALALSGFGLVALVERLATYRSSSGRFADR